MESLEYPEHVRGVGTSVAATWMFKAGCMYDCKSILLDRVSSVCQVVQFVGACAAMLRMGELTFVVKQFEEGKIIVSNYLNVFVHVFLMHNQVKCFVHLVQSKLGIYDCLCVNVAVEILCKSSIVSFT